MSEDLVCASCNGRVGDARCPTCRAALRRMRQDPPPVLPALPFLLAAVAVLLLLLALTQNH